MNIIVINNALAECYVDEEIKLKLQNCNEIKRVEPKKIVISISTGFFRGEKDKIFYLLEFKFLS